MVQSDSSAALKVGFYGAAPVAQPAALTAQLTTITIADTAGTPDYAMAAVTTTSAGGCSSAQEFISLLYVIKNLQVRMLEIEAILENNGMVTSN